MDPALRASFEAHLSGCPHCPHYLEQMRATIRVAGTITADDLSAGSPCRVARGLPQLQALGPLDQTA